jgi:hypothetical protein
VAAAPEPAGAAAAAESADPGAGEAG